MERKTETFIKLVIPTNILGDKNLTPFERLLLIYILSLCKKKGYCWAKNRHLSENFDISKQTISKSISSLSKYGYIVVKHSNKEKNDDKRKIIISEVFKKRISDIQENFNTSIQENFKLYNKNNYKRNNIGPIISKDVDGVELWNGKRVESQPPTEKEKKYMESLLSSFRKGDE